METENKDKWTPEVGKTAWLASAHNVMQLEIIEEGISAPPSFRCKGMGFNAFIFAYKLFPTAEAALASIKAYDLEGKEVVIPRAEPVLDTNGVLLSIRVAAANAFNDIERAAFDRGVHYKGVVEWTQSAT